MKFLASVKQIARNWCGFTPSPISKESSAVLHGYDTILLKTYVDIATTGFVEFLIISGRPTQEELIDRWEEIIQKNGEENHDSKYEVYSSLIRVYAEFIARHTVLSILLEILFYKVDFKHIEEVRSRGYVINTESDQAYEESLKKSTRKVSDLNTKAEMRRKELERQFPAKKEGSKVPSYEEIVSQLELSLGAAKILMVIDRETLTLAKYNILKAGIRARNESTAKQQSNG